MFNDWVLFVIYLFLTDKIPCFKITVEEIIFTFYCVLVKGFVFYICLVIIKLVKI